MAVWRVERRQHEKEEKQTEVNDKKKSADTEERIRKRTRYRIRQFAK